MKTSTVLFSVVGVVLAISLLCIWFFPSAQDFMISNTIWNGVNDFSRESGAKGINSLLPLADSPERTALVLVPYRQPENAQMAAVQLFLDSGGTLILMDDYGYGNDVLNYLGLAVRFSGKPLLDPLFCYRNQRLPRVTGIAPDVRALGVNVLVLNHATALEGIDPAAQIAWSSDAGFLDTNDDGKWETGEPEGPLPVAARFRYGKGIINVVADPSIMINSMVGRDDNHRFMEYLTLDYKGDKLNVIIDQLHLPEAPLDTSKTRLIDIRKMLGNPYALMIVIGFIFLIVSRYTLKKGGTVG
jgi:hypothetical protein